MARAASSPASRAGRPASSSAAISSRAASSAAAPCSPPRAPLRTRSRRRSTCSRSAMVSSRSTASASATGSMRSSGWGTSALAKARTTWMRASAWRSWPSAAPPRPSPAPAPAASPAMSTSCTWAGTRRGMSWASAIASMRGSGTSAIARAGSRVVNGYGAISASAPVTSANRAVLPALARPTRPRSRALLGPRSRRAGGLARREAHVEQLALVDPVRALLGDDLAPGRARGRRRGPASSPWPPTPPPSGGGRCRPRIRAPVCASPCGRV